jgi:hypothetical protein
MKLRTKISLTLLMITSSFHLMAQAIDFYKINSTKFGNSWQLIKTSDSTFKIQWTSNSRIKETTSEFETHLSERFHVVMENADFIALRAERGSDAWFDIYLPLNENEPAFSLENPLAYDEINNFVAVEELGDTILKIINLKTKHEQPIIEKSNPCSSAFNHYCINSISFSNGSLHYKWTTPNKIDSNKYVEKKVIIKI